MIVYCIKKFRMLINVQLFLFLKLCLQLEFSRWYISLLCMFLCYVISPKTLLRVGLTVLTMAVYFQMLMNNRYFYLWTIFFVSFKQDSKYKSYWLEFPPLCVMNLPRVQEWIFYKIYYFHKRRVSTSAMSLSSFRFSIKQSRERSKDGRCEKTKYLQN